MIDFNLYADVIQDFSTDETFDRYTTVINNIGVEEKTLSQSIVIFCYPHPATDADIREIARDGYRIEDMIKIFAPVEADIIPDDEITYRNKQYRVMKDNIKLVGDYSKFFAELLEV